MNDQVADGIRRHLDQVISILPPYALSTGPINKQNATTAIRLATAYLSLGRSSARQAAVMTLEMLIEWHQQCAGECFAILARATHMPKAEADALEGDRAIPYRSVALAADP